MKNKKKRYIVYYTGLFERGYMKLSVIKKTCEHKLNNDIEGIAFASKFRFKFIAVFYCFVLNKCDADLRTFEVKEIFV
jgi:hypothetical protein